MIPLFLLFGVVIYNIPYGVYFVNQSVSLFSHFPISSPQVPAKCPNKNPQFFKRVPA